MAVIINEASIQRKMNEALNNADKKQARDVAKEKAKSVAHVVSLDMIDALEFHPVTRELEGGVSTNSPFIGRGSLVGYFGLPMELAYSSILGFKSLMGKYAIDVRKIIKKPQYRIKISFPPIETYYKAAPAPTEYGGSWLEKMENGLLQNFSHFINLLGISASRTGGGIQSKYAIKKNLGKRVPSIPYISDIYGKFFGRGKRANQILSETIKKL